MSLENFTVRRRKIGARRAKNYASEVQVYNTANIVYAIPSVCNKDGISDGLVNSEVLIKGAASEGDVKVWCTQTVAQIEALDDA